MFLSLVVQLLSMSDSATPWIAACQASLSITNSQGLLKLRSIRSVMPSNHLSSSVIPLSSCLQSFPASGSFPMRQFFASCGQNVGVSASASVLQVNIQGWFPLGLTGLISLPSRGNSQMSPPSPPFESISSLALSFMVRLSQLYMTTGKTTGLKE